MIVDSPADIEEDRDGDAVKIGDEVVSVGDVLLLSELNDGMGVGSTEVWNDAGSDVGFIYDTLVGTVVGLSVVIADGASVGLMVGELEGFVVGIAVGSDVGVAVVGVSVGP